MDLSIRDQVVANLKQVLREVSTVLPTENISDSHDLLDHGEWGESLDLLCTQLYEYEVPLSKDLYQLIDTTGRMMKMEPSGWDYLGELIQ
tara:strand:- start:76571 stop:76840 length:270 start_codon:yes stop_codon:yes gene_type:complete